MTRPPYSGLTNDELCDLINNTYSEYEAKWAAIELVRRKLCEGRDPADPRSNCVWAYHKGTVTDNKCVIPIEVAPLPECPASVFLTIRRQQYNPTDELAEIDGDFTLDYNTNTLNLNASLGLNGLAFYVRIWNGAS